MICKRCKVDKPETDFNAYKGNKCGRELTCKQCWREDGARKRAEYPLPNKFCEGCSKIKPVAEFGIHNRSADGYMKVCKECYSPGNNSRSRLRRTGWTEEEYQEAFRRQDGRCAICTEPAPDYQALCADHRHATLDKRGLLCAQCNQGLGKFKDNVTILQAAIDYLNQYSKE